MQTEIVLLILLFGADSLGSSSRPLNKKSLRATRADCPGWSSVCGPGRGHKSNSASGQWGRRLLFLLLANISLWKDWPLWLMLTGRCRLGQSCAVCSCLQELRLFFFSLRIACNFIPHLLSIFFQTYALWSGVTINILIEAVPAQHIMNRRQNIAL